MRAQLGSLPSCCARPACAACLPCRLPILRWQQLRFNRLHASSSRAAAPHCEAAPRISVPAAAPQPDPPASLPRPQVDACADPAAVRAVAARREQTVCISGLTGEGLPELLERVSHKLQVGGAGRVFAPLGLCWCVGGWGRSCWSACRTSCRRAQVSLLLMHRQWVCGTAGLHQLGGDSGALPWLLQCTFLLIIPRLVPRPRLPPAHQAQDSTVAVHVIIPFLTPVPPPPCLHPGIPLCHRRTQWLPCT